MLQANQGSRAILESQGSRAILESQVFIGGAVADSSGTFQVEIRPRKREREGGPLKPGLHGIVVLGSKNGGASAPLMVTPKPEG